VTLRCTPGEFGLILHALRAAPVDRNAASHRLADVLAAKAAISGGSRATAPR
jgi:hypothetical protein